MSTSRLSRVEEKRTKNRLYKIILITIIILGLVVFLGIPIFVRVSAFLGVMNSQGANPDSTDKTPPFAPILSPISEATNSAELKIEGYAEPETTLILTINDEIVKQETLSTEGSFAFTDLVLEMGTNKISAKAKDSAGNESANSNELTVTYKKGAPKLEISEPNENQTFAKNQQEIAIIGKTDKENTIYINDRFVSVDNDGNFKFPVKLNDGENQFKITAQDPAGNTTELVRTVKYSAA